MIRRLVAMVVAAFISSTSSIALAGDDAAHRKAGEDGIDMTIANNGGADVCPPAFATKSAIGPKCPFTLLTPWGDSVRGPDAWPCFTSNGSEDVENYRQIPPRMNRVQWELGGKISGTSPLACNWTHFASNPMVKFGPVEINGAWAQGVTEEWADVMLDHIRSSSQRYKYQEFCNGPTFETFVRRSLQAVHFPHDAACKHHDVGNEVCTPTSFGGWGRTCTTWLKSTSKSALEGYGWSGFPSTAPTPSLRCDDEIRQFGRASYAFPFGFKYVYSPRYWVKMYAPCMKSGLAVACAGYERTLRHHCEINWKDRDYTPGDTSLFYGECSTANFSSSAGTYPTKGAGIAAKIVAKHLATWKETCTPPTQPCDSTACWEWCERSTTIPVELASKIKPFGACSASPGDSKTCKLTTCECATTSQSDYGNVCGKSGKPSCPDQTGRPKCESGLAVDESTNLCAPCGAAGQVCCADDKCVDGTCAAATGSCVKTCGPSGPTCTKKSCSSSVLWRMAWCPELCDCVSACLCEEPDPFDGSSCLSWSDEWSKTGCKGPNPVKCF